LTQENDLYERALSLLVPVAQSENTSISQHSPPLPIVEAEVKPQDKARDLIPNDELPIESHIAGMKTNLRVPLKPKHKASRYLLRSSLPRNFRPLTMNY